MSGLRLDGMARESVCVKQEVDIAKSGLNDMDHCGLLISKRSALQTPLGNRTRGSQHTTPASGDRRRRMNRRFPGRPLLRAASRPQRGRAACGSFSLRNVLRPAEGGGRRGTAAPPLF